MDSYEVTIVGITWGGFRSSYDYSFDHLPTEFEIRQRAGDFQDVTDYEIERMSRDLQVRGQTSVETITRSIVRAFQREESLEVLSR